MGRFPAPRDSRKWRWRAWHSAAEKPPSALIAPILVELAPGELDQLRARRGQPGQRALVGLRDFLVQANVELVARNAQAQARSATPGAASALSSPDMIASSSTQSPRECASGPIESSRDSG